MSDPRGRRRLLSGWLMVLLLTAGCAAGGVPGGGEAKDEAPGEASTEEAAPGKAPAVEPRPAVHQPPADLPSLPAAAAARLETDRREERRRQYLEQVLAGLHRLERAVGGLGPARDAAGVLAAAALATEEDPRTDPLRHHVRAVLADCAPEAGGSGWHRRDCPRAQIPLLRAVLQYPEALERAVPEDLLAQLRSGVTVGAPAPPPAEIDDPWSFRDTENQRAVRMARALVGQVAAGTPESENARGWSAFAEAFLTAHDRDGWYEADSPGYLPISMNALLLLADHAPTDEVRRLAARQLDVLFARWAQNQVAGYPAGAKARAYVHWALTDGNVAWPAWRWLLTGAGDPGRVNFRDFPDLAAARYRVPEAVPRILAGRRLASPYSVTERRTIVAHRVNQDSALYAWATPDYVLGVSQAVEGLRLRVSGSHRIVATLFPEIGGAGGDGDGGESFAPVYLWSRTLNPRGDGGGQKWTGDDLAAAWRNRAVARLGVNHGGGHAYVSPPWGELRVAGSVVTTRLGDTYLALVTEGPWQVAPAAERFPELYQDRRLVQGARVAVPSTQPASVGVIVGRRAEDGDFESFENRARLSRLWLEQGAIHFQPGGEEPLMIFRPGQTLEVGGAALQVPSPLVRGPFLGRPATGGWRLQPAADGLDYPPLTGEAPGRPPPGEDPAEGSR